MRINDRLITAHGTNYEIFILVQCINLIFIRKENTFCITLDKNIIKIQNSFLWCVVCISVTMHSSPSTRHLSV